jgi:hypothetical protein
MERQKTGLGHGIGWCSGSEKLRNRFVGKCFDMRKERRV